MHQGLAASHAVQRVALFAQALWRDQHSDRPPNGFLGGVAKHLFSRTIPRGDDAVEIFGDDRIIRRLDDRRQTECVVGCGGSHTARLYASDRYATSTGSILRPAPWRRPATGIWKPRRIASERGIRSAAA